MERDGHGPLVVRRRRHDAPLEGSVPASFSLPSDHLPDPLPTPLPSSADNDHQRRTPTAGPAPPCSTPSRPRPPARTAPTPRWPDESHPAARGESDAMRVFPSRLRPGHRVQVHARVTPLRLDRRAIVPSRPPPSAPARPLASLPRPNLPSSHALDCPRASANATLSGVQATGSCSCRSGSRSGCPSFPWARARPANASASERMRSSARGPCPCRTDDGGASASASETSRTTTSQSRSRCRCPSPRRTTTRPSARGPCARRPRARPAGARAPRGCARPCPSWLVPKTAPGGR